MADLTRKEITNSLSSIKGFGSNVANTLYAVPQSCCNSFTDVLLYLDNHSLKRATVLPLIKIDYFAQYGNCVELQRILDFFDLMAQGTAKMVKREKLNEAETKIVAQYSNGKNKDGSDGKSFRIESMSDILRAYEQYIKSLHLTDVNFKVKSAMQLEILGYVDLTTNEQEDRRKLIITSEPLPQLDKKTGEPWVYRFDIKSIGTGRTARISIQPELFNQDPFKKGDLIFASIVRNNNKGIPYLFNYHILYEISD